MAQVIKRLFRGNVYLEGKGYAGSFEECDLPALKWAGSDLKGLAMVGKTKLPTAVDELKLTLKGHLDEAFAAQAGDCTRFLNVQVRSDQIEYGGDGIVAEKPVVAYCRGWFEEVNPGAVKGQEEGSGAQYVMVLVAYKLVVDGKILWDIDLFQNKCLVNGKDIFETANANLGL